MPTDPDHTTPVVQIVSWLHSDSRLLIGAGVIAGHSAQQAGLPEAAQEHLATATREACGELLSLAGTNPKSAPEVHVTASRYPDRIEIAVQLSVASAQVQGSSHSQGHDGKHADKLLKDGLVDEVQRETRDGRPSIILIKYCRPVKSKT
ncbi:MAG TPA: hypothetical protein VHX36_13570 [Candidatus Acidoferrales bacterium]|nr:hypothetical protein [Candidatus Acidoferrales bacterium]